MNLLKKITAHIFLILIFIFADQIVLSAQPNSQLFSASNRLKFGNYLFKQKDFIRAIDEYKAILPLIGNDTTKFKIGFAYSRLGNYDEAFKIFQSFKNQKTLIDAAEFELTRINFLNNNFSESITPARSSNQYSGNINKLKYYSYLVNDAELPDSNLLFSFYKNDELEFVRNFYHQKTNMEYKSPTFAAILSTVIPGAGKLYTGNTGDGITSFLLTGLFTFLAYDNFSADHKIRGWIFTGVAAFFYAGNIYGSAAAADIYNAGIKLNLDNEIKFYINRKNYFTPNYNFLNK